MSFEIENNRVILNEPLVDIEKIFELVNKLKEIESETIIIDMKNNYSLPSTVIGELMFLKNKGLNIEIWVYDELLYSLLKDLGLTDMFKVIKK